MKSIQLLAVFLLMSTVTTHGMNEMVHYVPSSWCGLLPDIKTGIIARSADVDKASLRLVNQELAKLASKANFEEMIKHYPCVMDRAHHIEFMINYSSQKDEKAKNIIRLLIKNAQLCGHADVLDIVPHFYPTIADTESLINAIKTETLKPGDADKIIPAFTLLYKENLDDKILSKIIIPEIMDIYGGSQSAIKRYKHRYQQQKEVATTHLHIAVEQDHTAIVELFIMQNPNLFYQTDADGMIPLAIAVLKNNLAMDNMDIIKLLQKCNKRGKLETKIDIPCEKTPCFFAAQAGNTDCLKQLLTHDIFVDSYATKPLHIAAANNHIQTIAMLLADPHTDINAKSEVLHTPFHVAIYSSAQPNNNFNPIPIVQLLLAKGALLNEKDAAGATPFMAAIQSQSSLEVVQFLIKQPGIDIDACIDLQLSLCQKEWLEKSIDEKQMAQLKRTQGLSTLCYAANLGNDTIVQLLLDNGAALYNNTMTPLIMAIQGGHYDIVKKIVTHSPHNINDTCTITTNNNLYSDVNALYIAINTKRKDIVEYLLANGAHLNTCCMSFLNMSPLLVAIAVEDLEIVKLLVEKGADINHQAQKGTTAIDLARRKNNQPIIDFLMSQPNIILT